MGVFPLKAAVRSRQPPPEMQESSRGDVSIQNSTVKVSEVENYYAVTANGTTTVTGSWVETNHENSVNGSITDSVIFNGDSGTVIGNATLLGNTTLDARRSSSRRASLSVGAGNTFTNNGVVTVKGGFFTDGGTLVCNNYSGGTATCTAPAHCDVCQKSYGDKNWPTTRRCSMWTPRQLPLRPRVILSTGTAQTAVSTTVMPLRRTRSHRRRR